MAKPVSDWSMPMTTPVSLLRANSPPGKDFAPGMSRTGGGSALRLTFTAEPLDLEVEVPARLLQILDGLGRILLACAGYVLHAVPQVRVGVQPPGFEALDDLVRVVVTTVVRRVVHRFSRHHLLRSYSASGTSHLGPFCV